MSISPGGWSRLREMFEAARALPPAARAAYLDAECGDDEELRREVEALLDSHERAASFLEQPAHLAGVIEPITTHLEGHRVGPYLVHARIGAGGMGEVYRAHDTRLDRTVAIKVLPARVAMDRLTRERFDREARAVAALNHPHICTLHDVGEAPNPSASGAGESIRFFVMEFVEGTTLDGFDQLPIDVTRAVAIGAQVCDALEAAHAKGIVHRDIKPQNIMVSPRGHVKVLDFGVAKLEVATDQTVNVTQPKTRTGLIMGTLPYMSPEQICGDPLSGASDVFSLGVVLYQLITGRHPFVGAGAHAQMQAMAQALLVHAPMAPRRLNPAIPVPFESLLLRMLDKAPAARPSAAEARRLLSDPLISSVVPSARSTARTARAHTVGRQRERASLEQAFDEAAAGHPILMAVAGEPGIGKTTIVEEFLTAVRADGRSYVARGRCSERLAGSEAYLPVLEALENLLVGDDRHSGAQTLMADLAPTWYAQVAPAGHAASTGVGAQLELKNASQERMKRELRSFLEAIARVKPLVVFFDDLHWADASTVDLLGYISSQFTTGARVLIVVTYRPTDLLLAKHPFAALKLDLAARGLCREVPLGFLGLEETARYLELEFPVHNFPPTLAALIHGKTEGSPLFMVDLVRDLRDREVIVASASGWLLAQSVPALERDLPESVRSMIERKIGQLADDDRQLLICASVQGHAFDSAVVARALGKDAADVEERLEVLDRVHAFIGVLGEATLPTGAVTMRCRFVHVLYQNALYASLRATRRAALSAAVANAIIHFHGPDHAASASELAILFDTARDPARAASYFLIASQNALRVFAFVEAAAIAERGLAQLSGLPESAERNRTELQLQIALGTASVAIRGYASRDVERAYGRARELCRQIGEAAELGSVLFGLHVYYVVAPSYRTSLELGDEMLALADREHDDGLRVQGLLTHGMARFWLGDVEIGLTALEQGIELYDRRRITTSGNTPLFDHGVACRRYDAVCLWLRGYPDQAARRADEAIAAARSMQHPLTLASTLGFISMLGYFRRDAAAARNAAAEAVSCTTEYVLTYWHGFAAALHGWSVAQLAHRAGDQARLEAGADEIRRSIESHRAAGARTFSPIAWALLSECYVLQSRSADAISALGEGLALANTTDECFWVAEIHRLRGEIARLHGVAADAERHFQQAIAVAREKGEKSLELRALISLYTLVQAQSGAKSVRAREELEQAYEWFTEGFGTPDLQTAAALLRTDRVS